MYYGCGVGIKWNLSISRRHCPENRRELDLRNFTWKVSSSGTTAGIATLHRYMYQHTSTLHMEDYIHIHTVLMVLHNYNISIVEDVCTVHIYKFSMGNAAVDTATVCVADERKLSE